MANRGPRPAGVDTRSDILEAARAAFAAKGYTGTSVRGVAREAGVDPALVYHYFASKPALFFASVRPDAADVEPVLDPQQVVDAVLQGPLESLGERWVLMFLTFWDQAGRDRFRALIHGATSADQAMIPIRQFLAAEILHPIVARLGADEPELRVQLAASQMIGLAFGRYVGVFPELVEPSPQRLATLVGPVIQSHLVSPLPSRLADG